MSDAKTKLLDAANAALACFAEDTWISFDGSYVIINWRDRRNAIVSKRWMTRGQDFYPTWHDKWCRGGTAATALSQLVRWIQGKPVLPLSTWRYWVGDKCQLARSKDFECLQALRDGGYPEDVNCVLCDQKIEGGMDWWSLDGLSGPCCSPRSGCQQKGGAA